MAKNIKMSDTIILYFTRIILTAILMYGLYVIWTREVNIVKWVQNQVDNSIPIDESKDLQLEKVNLLVSGNQKGILSLYIQMEKEVDKIQDIEMYITTKTRNGNSGRVGLKTIREFKYYYDLLLEPYSTTDFIDQRILDYQKFASTGPDGIDTTKVNLKSFPGDKIFLEWRDAENKKHVKNWPYERYRHIVDGLKKGPMKLEKEKNVYVSEMNL